VRKLRYPIAFVVVLALSWLTAWIFSWSFSKAIILAPVIVCAAAAIVGLIILWGKIAYEQLRESRHPRRILAYWLIGLALLVLMTVLGVKLPSEGG